MAVDAVRPGARVGVQRHQVVGKNAPEAPKGRSEGALIALVCLIELVWISGVVYCAFQAQDFVRGLF